MNLLKSIFFFTVFFLAFSGILSAQNANLDEEMNEAIELYKQGKYSEAFSLFEILANDPGNEKAKFFLASMYETGKGVEKDYKKAVEIFKSLAKTGNSFALRELGILYHYGWGVKADERKSFRYFQLAAQRGNIQALYIIGYVYMQGVLPHAPQNFKKAEKYFKDAASKGFSPAKIYLASLYLLDDYPDPDYKLALESLNSIDEKDPSYGMAQTILGTMYYQGKGVAEDKKKATEIFSKIVKTNNAPALNGCAYYLALRNTNLDYAMTYIQKALKMELLNGAYIDTYGYILYKQGKYKEALKEFLFAEQYYTVPSADIKRHIGDTYHALGEDDKALKAWAEAFQQVGTNQKLQKEILPDYITTVMKQQRKISLTPEGSPANAD